MADALTNFTNTFSNLIYDVELPNILKVIRKKSLQNLD
jgi:hypothetical protein